MWCRVGAQDILEGSDGVNFDIPTHNLCPTCEEIYVQECCQLSHGQNPFLSSPQAEIPWGFNGGCLCGGCILSRTNCHCRDTFLHSKSGSPLSSPCCLPSKVYSTEVFSMQLGGHEVRAVKKFVGESVCQTVWELLLDFDFWKSKVESCCRELLNVNILHHSALLQNLIYHWGLCTLPFEHGLEVMQNVGAVFLFSNLVLLLKPREACRRQVTQSSALANPMGLWGHGSMTGKKPAIDLQSLHYYSSWGKLLLFTCYSIFYSYKGSFLAYQLSGQWSAIRTLFGFSLQPFSGRSMMLFTWLLL